MLLLLGPVICMQRPNLTVFEYIRDVNLENRTNYKLNIWEKIGNMSGFTSLPAVCLLWWIIQCETSLEIELCSDWSAILVEKNKSLIFARAFGYRRLGRVVSGAASRSEEMGSIPTRNFPPWLRGRIVSPSKVGITQRLNLSWN